MKVYVAVGNVTDFDGDRRVLGVFKHKPSEGHCISLAKTMVSEFDERLDEVYIMEFDVEEEKY